MWLGAACPTPRSGAITNLNNAVPWRGDSHLADQYNGSSLLGGWYDDGGTVKMTYSMATAVMMLAWGLQEFRTVGDLAANGSQQAGASRRGELHWLHAAMQCDAAAAASCSSLWRQQAFEPLEAPRLVEAPGMMCCLVHARMGCWRWLGQCKGRPNSLARAHLQCTGMSPGLAAMAAGLPVHACALPRPQHHQVGLGLPGELEGRLASF
jgi:hypothetical protein